VLCVASGQSYGHRGSALFEGRRHFPHVILRIGTFEQFSELDTNSVF